MKRQKIVEVLDSQPGLKDWKQIMKKMKNVQQNINKLNIKHNKLNETH